MAINQLALTALLAVAAAPESMLLTPDTVAEHGYHFRCIVDQPDRGRAQPTRPTGPLRVRLRFGLVQKGRYAVSAADLQAIRAIFLVVRDGDAVQLSIPLSVEVDPGNVIHLYSEFTTQRDLLSKMQLVFDEVGERGPRTFIVPLAAFIEQK